MSNPVIAGGGDTLHELKILLPGLYHAAIDSAKYYLFTGGGTVLKVIEEGDPYDLAPIKALMDNAVRFGTPTRAVIEKLKSEGKGRVAAPPAGLSGHFLTTSLVCAYKKNGDRFPLVESGGGVWPRL